ncbi:Hypothetical protein, putative [Bodo saltans]|uniref:Uncharacterized protein n=1 Tax=Bodo saltans TaxID=75058 RepID=A0A0S4JRE6_BODSA|nr:Hypothetical protein, putative [Bodo saltans]|eukprot:CUG91888.1 Hypothetical protein, putative [Bodo saltans]
MTNSTVDGSRPTSPRRPLSAPSSSHRFHGVQRTPLPSSEVMMSKASPTTMLITVPRPTSPRAGTPKTQREVSQNLRERILNIERKKMYGACSTNRPRFQVTKRVDPSLLLRRPDSSAASIPAPPPSLVIAGAKTKHSTPVSGDERVASSLAASSRPPFQIRPNRRTIYDIQVSAARTESLQHTEPYVRIRPFAKILRLPEDEATEYVEAELEAGYYKRWVYNVEGKRPDMPPSLEQFFGDREDFEAQDDVAIKEWRDRITAAAAEHHGTPQKK